MSFDFTLASLRLRKVLFALGNQRGRAGLSCGVAASIEHQCALKPYHFNTVVDVGANRGQFALFCRNAFPEAKIISFEPLPAPAKVLRKLFSNDPLVELRATALGDRASKITMHITARDDSSSLLAVGDAQTRSFGTVEVASRDVVVGRLDENLALEEIKAPALLKIDVQGFEFQVLQGAGELISEFDVIFVECSYKELYYGQVLVPDIIRLLDRRGFVLGGVFNQNAEAGGSVLQADFLFCRNSPI